MGEARSTIESQILTNQKLESTVNMGNTLNIGTYNYYMHVRTNEHINYTTYTCLKFISYMLKIQRIIHIHMYSIINISN